MAKAILATQVKAGERIGTPSGIISEIHHVQIIDDRGVVSLVCTDGIVVELPKSQVVYRLKK